jgi:hypothetical protein
MEAAPHRDIDAIRSHPTAIVDVRIPGSERLPSGRSVGADQDLADRVLNPNLNLLTHGEFGHPTSTITHLPIPQMQAWDMGMFESVKHRTHGRLLHGARGTTFARRSMRSTSRLGRNQLCLQLSRT